MLNFLKPNKPQEPLTYEARKYFEHNFLWLCQTFPEPSIELRKVFTPIWDDLPVTWNKSQQNVREALEIICPHMQLDANSIELEFFSNGMTQLDAGANPLFLESDPRDFQAAGLYLHKNAAGKFVISIAINQLEDPTGLIATLVHELSHVKLLGEEHIDVNDEMLTDLATVVFGFGIFNANAAFTFNQQLDRWSTTRTGYLKLEEWAYALALFAFIRHEDEPSWASHISRSLKNDFDQSLQYMLRNEEEIFRLDVEEN